MIQYDYGVITTSDYLDWGVFEREEGWGGGSCVVLCFVVHIPVLY